MGPSPQKLYESQDSTNGDCRGPRLLDVYLPNARATFLPTIRRKTQTVVKTNQQLIGPSESDFFAIVENELCNFNEVNEWVHT
jgi:hypothetical protein